MLGFGASAINADGLVVGEFVGSDNVTLGTCNKGRGEVSRQLASYMLGLGSDLTPNTFFLITTLHTPPWSGVECRKSDDRKARRENPQGCLTP